VAYISTIQPSPKADSRSQHRKIQVSIELEICLQPYRNKKTEWQERQKQPKLTFWEGAKKRDYNKHPESL